VTKTALIPIADGSEEIEVVCLIDVLRRAEVVVTVASVMDAREITASRGTTIVADALISDCSGQQYDLIALPGGMPGAEHLRDCEPLIEMLGEQRDAGRLYGAVCASPALALLPHGLLAGRRATCYPSFRAELDNATDVKTADDPVALRLVALLFKDETKAQEIQERMLIT